MQDRVGVTSLTVKLWTHLELNGTAREMCSFCLHKVADTVLNIVVHATILRNFARFYTSILWSQYVVYTTYA